MHRLVLEAFVPRVRGKRYANHKNGDKRDSRAVNLEWVTHSENQLHAFNTGLAPVGERHGNAKLTEAQVREIITRVRAGESQRSVAKDYGIKHPAVSNIMNGKSWKRTIGSV